MRRANKDFEKIEDFELLQKAFVEVMNEKEQAALDAFPGKPQYTKRHLREMKKILSGKRTSPEKKAKTLPKKRILAVLIAAILLLLGGITIYGKREAVVEMVRHIYETFTEVTYETEKETLPDEIEEERIPTYLPEGYVLQEHESSIILVRIVWEKKGQLMVFEQRTIDDVYVFDNEHGEHATLTVDNYTVNLQKSVNTDYYLWTDNEYTYSLYCPNTLSFDEVSKMIQSVPKGN